MSEPIECSARVRAQVDAVLERMAQSYGPDPETGTFDSLDMRRADALVELTSQRLADDADPETCMVVVHADAAVIDGLGDGIRHLHHIEHWVRDGGPTDSCNLCGLSWHHHRLVHEGGWSIAGNADRELTFRSPYGREVRSRPQGISPATRTRAEQAAGLTLHPTSAPEHDHAP